MQEDPKISLGVVEQSETPETPQETLAPRGSEVSLTNLKKSYAEDSNAQIIEQLKEQRDQLRSAGIDQDPNKPLTKKSRLKKVALLIFVLLVLCTGLFYLKTQNSNNSIANVSADQKKKFNLPSNIQNKTSDEKNALAVIALARNNDSATIINNYLSRAQLGESSEQFQKLIESYGNSADGESVELIEKAVGTVDFASTGESSAIAETASTFEAVSLIYKSDQYKSNQKIYLKINLYKPDPAVDSWKIYIFEFKSTDEQQSPLKADIHIPI